MVRGLGEVVLRVRDLERMQRFYTRVADGYGGHTQIVGLFAASVAPQVELLRRHS